jgi:copper chaperone
MTTWDIDNVKCGGCAKRIVQKLQDIDGVSAVNVDVDQGQVSFDADESRVTEVEKLLQSLGYPRTGTTAGLSAVGADVRSVVSCAIGRLQSD